MPENSQHFGTLPAGFPDIPTGAEVVQVYNSPGPQGPMCWDVRVTYLSGKQETILRVRNAWKYKDDVDYDGDGPGSPVGISGIGRHRKYMIKLEARRTACGVAP